MRQSEGEGERQKRKKSRRRRLVQKKEAQIERDKRLLHNKDYAEVGK